MSEKKKEEITKERMKWMKKKKHVTLTQTRTTTHINNTYILGLISDLKHTFLVKSWKNLTMTINYEHIFWNMLTMPDTPTIANTITIEWFACKQPVNASHFIIYAENAAFVQKALYRRWLLLLLLLFFAQKLNRLFRKYTNIAITKWEKWSVANISGCFSFCRQPQWSYFFCCK